MGVPLPCEGAPPDAWLPANGRRGRAWLRARSDAARALRLEPRAEFFVTPDRKVQITFLAKDGTAIAPAAQIPTVTAGDRAAPTKLTFARKGNVLLSTSPLPAGNDFPVVVEIEPSPGATKIVEKFYFDSSQCGECKNAEYACICEH